MSVPLDDPQVLASSRHEDHACFCGVPDDDYMVACSNWQYHRGDLWFHYECVGLDDGPEEDEDWFCPDCSGLIEGEDNEGSEAAQKARLLESAAEDSPENMPSNNDDDDAGSAFPGHAGASSDRRAEVGRPAVPIEQFDDSSTSADDECTASPSRPQRSARRHRSDIVPHEASTSPQDTPSPDNPIPTTESAITEDQRGAASQHDQGNALKHSRAQKKPDDDKDSQTSETNSTRPSGLPSKRAVVAASAKRRHRRVIESEDEDATAGDAAKKRKTASGKDLDVSAQGINPFQKPPVQSQEEAGFKDVTELIFSAPLPPRDQLAQLLGNYITAEHHGIYGYLRVNPVQEAIVWEKKPFEHGGASISLSNDTQVLYKDAEAHGILLVKTTTSAISYPDGHTGSSFPLPRKLFFDIKLRDKLSESRSAVHEYDPREVVHNRCTMNHFLLDIIKLLRPKRNRQGGYARALNIGSS